MVMDHPRWLPGLQSGAAAARAVLEASRLFAGENDVRFDQQVKGTWLEQRVRLSQQTDCIRALTLYHS